MTKSIYKKMSMLKIIKPYVTQEQLAYIGNSIVNSIILYAAPIWAQTTEYNFKRIQKAQVKVSQMIAWDPKKQQKKKKKNIEKPC